MMRLSETEKTLLSTCRMAFEYLELAGYRESDGEPRQRVLDALHLAIATAEGTLAENQPQEVP